MEPIPTTSGLQKNKRKRSKNFTDLETHFLIDIVMKHVTVIENKKTNAVTWQEKEKVWNEVAIEFQALAGIDRSATVLRAKYDAIKHKVKSKITKNKMEIFKTGGGSAEIQELADYEEQLLGYTSLNTEGLPSNFDSDAILVDKLMEIDEPKERNETDLQLSSKSARATTEKFQPAGVLTECNEIPMLNADQVTTKADINTAQCSSKLSKAKENYNWDTWTPDKLKAKKHKCLQNTRRPITKDTLNEKLDSMIMSRSELLKLQQELTLKEVQAKEEELIQSKIFTEKERELKLQLLQSKIANQKLKMQLLKRQLDNDTLF